jgi:acetolactate synthase small subunit
MSAFLYFLQSSLVVDVVTGDSPSSALPLVTQFIVKNVAEKSEENPEIYFEEVSLTVGVPPNMHVEKHADLASGESFTYEHHSRYSDLGKIVYSVDGRISPSRLLRVKKTVTNIPARVASISIASYVEILKDINIHKWLRENIEGMIIPGSDNTQTEIKAQQDKFGDAVKEISDIKNQLGRIYNFVASHTDTDRKSMTNHRKLIDSYLTRTDQACNELRKMLETYNAKTIDAARNKLVGSLREEANKLDEASQRLLN